MLLCRPAGHQIPTVAQEVLCSTSPARGTPSSPASPWPLPAQLSFRIPPDLLMTLPHSAVRPGTSATRHTRRGSCIPERAGRRWVSRRRPPDQTTPLANIVSYCPPMRGTLPAIQHVSPALRQRLLAMFDGEVSSHAARRLALGSEIWKHARGTPSTFNAAPAGGGKRRAATGGTASGGVPFPRTHNVTALVPPAERGLVRPGATNPSAKHVPAFRA